MEEHDWKWLYERTMQLEVLYKAKIEVLEALVKNKELQYNLVKHDFKGGFIFGLTAAIVTQIGFLWYRSS